MVVVLGWLLVFGLSNPIITQVAAQYQETGRRPSDSGGISVWTDRENPYRRGERARIYFRTEEPAYITVLRVDTDGRLRTLFPREPWRKTYVRADRTLEVAGSQDRRAF